MQRHQPRTEDDREDVEEQERAPSFLSARELQIPDPSAKTERAANERDPFDEEDGESPPVDKQQRKTPASASQKRSR